MLRVHNFSSVSEDNIQVPLSTLKQVLLTARSLANMLPVMEDKIHNRLSVPKCIKSLPEDSIKALTFQFHHIKEVSLKGVAFVLQNSLFCSLQLNRDALSRETQRWNFI